jgi:hypothetical protein
MDVGMAFMQSKTLLSAIDLELFTVVANHPMTAAQIGQRLAVHPRALTDFLDALVSMGFLNREGDGTSGVYANAADADMFLDKGKPSYIGGMLEMCSHRLYPFWGNLTEGLKTGEPQNEITNSEGDFFGELYADEARLEEFMRAMAGVQMGNFMMLAQVFNFSDFKSMCDVGGASGALAAQVAMKHEGVACHTMDLPAVTPLAKRALEAWGMNGRVEVLTGNFFESDLPKVDVITMGNILHDWNEDQKVMLLQKAYDALPSGGAFIAIEMVIDDERRKNTMGMMMSLNMLIETPGGFDYTGAQFDAWAKKAGFERTEIRPLTGPSSAAIAWKA